MATSIIRPAATARASTSLRCLFRASSAQTRHSSSSFLRSRQPASATFTSLSPASTAQAERQHQSIRKTSPRRSYSTDNTIQGTIEKGAAGVPDEAAEIRLALQAPEHLDEKERMIFEKLGRELKPVKLEVQDISGGCGSMYGIEIVSEAFRGLSMLKQQRLVNSVLGDEIKGWHGVQLKTRAP